jgi:catechol 2,3-dioxygenase-like lactoylglutathione lyase family enzyme
MIAVKRISHATLETPDLARQIAYFTDIVGLVPVARENGRAYLATRVGDLAVELEQAAAPRCARLSFQAAPDADLDELRRRVEGEGLRCEVRTDPAPGIAKAIVFPDPNGTLVQVFAAAAGPAGNGDAVSGIGPLKLGHVAFCVADPKPLAVFYCRVLGFRVSDWIEDWFVFLRCGPDHHTVNFVRGKRVKMHHMAFELKDWAHVQVACDFLGTHKIPIIWGPGRHGPGHNVYTYHRNPDDQIVELFTEMDKMLDEELGYFDPRPWHADRPQRPKVWQGKTARDVWGPPPTPDYLRERE